MRTPLTCVVAAGHTLGSELPYRRGAYAAQRGPPRREGRSAFIGELVRCRPICADALLRRNLWIYDLGGIIAPSVGIELIDLIVHSLFGT